MADMFDLELHEGDAGQDQQACCESDDDIIEIDDVSLANRSLGSSSSHPSSQHDYFGPIRQFHVVGQTELEFLGFSVSNSLQSRTFQLNYIRNISGKVNSKEI